jgi:hypothetical protein
MMSGSQSGRHVDASARALIIPTIAISIIRIITING